MIEYDIKRFMLHRIQGGHIFMQWGVKFNKIDHLAYVWEKFCDGVTIKPLVMPALQICIAYL